jgi:predicted TIM-barrel fold metal-dependent hydrolase
VDAAAALLRELEQVALVDHHAHAMPAGGPPTVDALRAGLCESPDPRQWEHVPNTLLHRRAIRELAAFLGCEPTEAAVAERRAAAAPEEHAAALLRAARIERLLIDDGFPPPGEGRGVEAMGRLAGCPAHRVLRLERVAEEALPEVRDLDELRERVRAAAAGARAAGAVALKTIAAYRSGLELAAPDPAAAADALARRPRRLEDRALVELLLWDALEATAADPLPLQVHVGFGDPDVRLGRAGPAGLAPLVARFPATPVVLLHCYPFVREAGWMASVYANVHMDLSLAIPHVARPAELVRQALELAPLSKLLYGSDAARVPELFLLAARWWRAALAEALAEALPSGEAAEAGRWILRENALRLYGLPNP